MSGVYLFPPAPGEVELSKERMIVGKYVRFGKWSVERAVMVMGEKVEGSRE